MKTYLCTRSKIRHVLSVASILVLALLGCETGDSVSTGPGSGVEVRPPESKVVCDPFNGNPALQGLGLQGSLYYLTDSMPRYSSVRDYMQFGVPVDAYLYFNNLNTPTRKFDLGFSNQEGEVVLNANGNTLYEYFGIHFESHFDLDIAAGDAPGDYQFAILSDDGAILDVNDSLAGYRTLVNNDGVHPTRMGCATTPLHLSGQAPVPIKLDYNQGPRYHISLILLYRPWPAQPNDPSCGTQGNSRFFDFNQTPSAPTQNYLDLLARGWKVATVNNYKLPGYDNPCVVTEPPVISNFTSTSITQNSVTFTWTTDQPSNSQVAYKLSAATDYSFTAVDNTMTTSHTVTVTGLTAFTFYNFYGLSTNASNQTAQSEVLGVRTLR